jgi:hypothetical protein
MYSPEQAALSVAHQQQSASQNAEPWCPQQVAEICQQATLPGEIAEHHPAGIEWQRTSGKTHCVTIHREPVTLYRWSLCTAANYAVQQQNAMENPLYPGHLLGGVLGGCSGWLGL